MQTEHTTDAPSTWDLLWSIRLSALYHLKRERFLDGVDKAAKFVSALGGAAAFSQIKDNANLGMVFVGFITVISCLSLVYGPASKARKHAELARDFRRLEADVMTPGAAITREQINKFTGQRLSLEASEPASLGALVTQCHNELCGSSGQKDQITPLRWRDRLFKNWCDIDKTKNA
jgi:hypothetical protein